MPVASAVRARVRALLAPGDDVRYVFPATLVTGSSAYVFIAVSDRAVTVLSVGFWRRGVPRSVLAHYPRGTRIGPVDTKLAPTFTLGGLWYETDEEYVAVINAADAEAGPEDFLPPDPLPDL